MRRGLALAALAITALALGGIFAVVLWDFNIRERWERVNFPISCSTASQRSFNIATTRLHQLRFRESEQAYAAIAKAEPDCAMAYWGIAMSRLRRPVPGLRPPDDIRAGLEALRSAAKASIATGRERAYIAALTSLYGEDGAASFDDRTIAYQEAMGILAAREQDDREATIFYALALNMVSRPLDKEFRMQTKAAELLLMVLAEQPHHPGLSHYLTYCLRASPDAPADVPASPQDQMVSLIQSGLAVLALIGVGGFFVAVLPVWSSSQRT
jgi:hypothetical protein